MLASPILLALGSLATSLLNAKGRFSASAMAPIVYNLAIIGGALFLGPIYGVYGLAIGVVAGSACHLGVQLLPLRGDRLPLVAARRPGRPGAPASRSS